MEERPREKPSPWKKHTEAPEALFNNLKAQFQVRIYSIPNYFVALKVCCSFLLKFLGKSRCEVRKGTGYVSLSELPDDDEEEGP